MADDNIPDANSDNHESDANCRDSDVAENSYGDGGECGGVKALESAASPADRGRQGELLIDPNRRRGDAQLVNRAARQWDIPAEAYSELPKRLLEYALTDTRPNVVINAGRALAAMHGQNQDAAKPAAPRQSLTVHYHGDISDKDQAALLAAARVLRRTAIPAIPAAE